MLRGKSIKVCKEQKNYVSRLYKREKTLFFLSLNVSVVAGNQKIWKTIKLLFPNKGNSFNKIKLVENEEIIDDVTKVTGGLNNFLKQW